MVYELSKGSLYPLQGGADEKVCASMIHSISDMVMYQSSNSMDRYQNEVRIQDQNSVYSDESENNDHSDSEHIDISSSSSIISERNMQWIITKLLNVFLDTSYPINSITVYYVPSVLLSYITRTTPFSQCKSKRFAVTFCVTSHYSSKKQFNHFIVTMHIMPRKTAIIAKVRGWL